MKLLNRFRLAYRLFAKSKKLTDDVLRPSAGRAKVIPTRFLSPQDWRANGNDVLWLRELFQDQRFQRFIAALRGGVSSLEIEFEKHKALAEYYRQIGREDVFRCMVALQEFEPEPIKDVPMDYSGSLQTEFSPEAI